VGRLVPGAAKREHLPAGPRALQTALKPVVALLRRASVRAVLAFTALLKLG
jgi:hypothetical protein